MGEFLSVVYLLKVCCLTLMRRIVVPFAIEDDVPLTDAEKEANKNFSTRRQPAEHIMALLKGHAMPSGMYRGGFGVLQASFRVIAHTTAYMLRNTERGAKIRIHSLRQQQDEQDWTPVEY